MTLPLACGVRLVLAVVFGFAGVAKATDLPGSRKATAAFGVPSWLASPVGTLLPVVEVAIAALLIPGGTARSGAAAAFVLLLLFLAAITFNLLHGRRPDCHCFGQVRSTPIGWSAVVRNAVLALGAGWLIVSAPPDSFRINALAGLSGALDVSGTLMLVALLAIALAAQTLWLWQLFRQQGRLLLRIDELERRLGGGNEALPIGATAPRFELLDSLLGRGIDVLAIFTDPNCGPCTSLLPTIAQWQQEDTPNVAIVVVTRGDVEANRALVNRHAIKNVVVQRDQEVNDAYRVAGTPAAVLVRSDGRIASAVALGPDAIARLRTDALAPVPSPEMRLADFGGASDVGRTPYGSAVR